MVSLCLVCVACDTALDDADGADTPAVECSQEAPQGGDEEFLFSSGYVVEDGELGALCFGTDDDTILDARDALATIAPEGPIGDLVLFGGFEPDG